jgi:hypothetical protein
MDCDRPAVTQAGARLSERIAELALARRRLAARPVDEILAALENVVEAWLDPGGAFMRAAPSALVRATGFSPEMIRFALPSMIEPLRAPALARLLDAELGDRHRLDAAPGGRRANGPGLVAHLLPGNLPGLAAIPVALTLALKAAALVKAGRGDRVSPFLLAESMATTDAELAECVAPLYWPGGDRGHEDVVFAAADLLVAYGDDATIADARARRQGPFIGHGHRVSFAVVTSEMANDPADADRAAAALALDTALWDQRGCLSPQLCYVEGDLGAARAFGERLAVALSEVADRLPAGSCTPAELAAVRRFRQEAEWRGFGRQAVTLFAAEGLTDGTVAVEPEAVFRPSPLGRSLRVLPIHGPGELTHLLEPARPALEAAGLAALPERERAWTQALRECGVHRVCPLGEMQRPALDWRQGGRPRVADWVSWTAGDDA